MKLFGKKDKKEQTCCCGGECTPETMEKAEVMKKSGGIIVLGSGCVKCHNLKKNVEEALETIGADVPVELITDFSVIASYGVLSTPALVIGNKVVSYGKVLSKEEAVNIIRESL